MLLGPGHALKRWSRSTRHSGTLRSLARGIAESLILRHGHGPQYMSHVFQAETRFLGIESSPSFVRAPEGNGVAERFSGR